MKYHEIGDRFEHDGVMLEVKEGRNCEVCYFYGKLLCNMGVHREMFCHNMTRNDGKRAYYKLVEQCKPKADDKKEANEPNSSFILDAIAKDAESIYNEIDEAQNLIIGSRMREDKESEAKGIMQMETVMCRAKQFAAYIIENSKAENKDKTDKEMAGHTPSVTNDTIVMNDIIDKLKETLFVKNSDYGKAFSEIFDELGMDYAYGKLREKINRIKVLRNQPNMVENESLEDALLDTAGYAILTLVELKKRNK